MQSVIIRCLSLLALISPLTVTAQPQTLPSGWSLMGNDTDGSIDVAAIFGTATTPSAISPSVTTVWSWNNALSRWNFFTPSMTSQGLFDYAALKGFDVMTTILKGQGYWVNAKNQCLYEPKGMINTNTINTNSGSAGGVDVGGGGGSGVQDINGSLNSGSSQSSSSPTTAIFDTSKFDNSIYGQ